MQQVQRVFGSLSYTESKYECSTNYLDGFLEF